MTNDTAQSNSSVNAYEIRNGEQVWFRKYREKDPHVYFPLEGESWEKSSTVI